MRLYHHIEHVALVEISEVCKSPPRINVVKVVHLGALATAFENWSTR